MNNDLTRWNRAGLGAFRYIDANAIVLLEELRAKLSESFPEWETLAAADKTATEKKQRIIEQYLRGRGLAPDWGWELARSFSRASHVLLEHINAYANEGYLSTATQWDSLRRILALLDYHPAPPSSASTFVTVHAKESGPLKTGLSFAHSPKGTAPIIFETLEHLNIETSLNKLYPKDWNRNLELFSGQWLILSGKISNLVLGEPIVIESAIEKTIQAHTILEIQERENTALKIFPAVKSITTADVLIHLKPKERLSPIGPLYENHQANTNQIHTPHASNFSIGELVYVQDKTKATYRTIQSIAGNIITLNESIIQFQTNQINITKTTSLSLELVKNSTLIQGQGIKFFYAIELSGDARRYKEKWLSWEFNEKREEHKITSAQYPITETDLRTSLEMMLPEPSNVLSLNSFGTKQIWFPAEEKGSYPADIPLLPKAEGEAPGTIYVSRPKFAAANDLAVLQSNSQISWSRLSSVTPSGSSYVLSSNGAWQKDVALGLFWRAETTLFCSFQEKRQLLHADQNNTPLSGKELELESIPTTLSPGRRLVLENQQTKASLLARVHEISGNKLAIDQELSQTFTRGNTIIYGNVALAGHGQQKSERILGHGNASQLQQSFLLEENDVSFVFDPLFSSGVRADVEILIDGQIWEQVESFRNQEAHAPVYTTRTTEEGFLRFTFGDGQHGRRLPTGQNNVRVKYRLGIGEQGNLPARSAVEVLSQNQLTDKVSLPLPATGGSSRQPIETLRKAAPKTGFTLGQAISLPDFAALAENYSGIWKASAKVLSSQGRSQWVEVAVVPSNGGTTLGPLAENLSRYLEQRTTPGTRVKVVPYVPVRLWLGVALEINTERFVAAEVTGQVQAQLLKEFSLQKRGFGQSVHISEVYKVVEGVRGVEASVCLFGGLPTQATWSVSQEQVLALDADPTQGVLLQITHKRYTP